MMTLTAVAAVITWFLKLGIAQGPGANYPWWFSWYDFLFTALVSSLTLIPFTYWMLSEPYRKRGYLYCLAWSAIFPFLYLQSFELLPIFPIIKERYVPSIGTPWVSRTNIEGIYCMCLTYCASVLFMLQVCHRAGFRLVTAWDAIGPEKPTASSPKLWPSDATDTP